MMTALHNLLSIQCTKSIDKLKTDDLVVSTMAKEVEKTKKWLYTDLNRPWLETQKSQNQLALEGQALMRHWSQMTGVKIT